MKNRVVMDVKVGERIAIGNVASVRVEEKSGRNRARLIIEVDEGVKLSRSAQAQAKPETAKA